jgi:hypothetical protein
MQPEEVVIASVVDGESEIIATEFQVQNYFVVHARDELGHSVVLKFANPAAQNLRSLLSALPKVAPPI